MTLTINLLYFWHCLHLVLHLTDKLYSKCLYLHSFFLRFPWDEYYYILSYLQLGAHAVTYIVHLYSHTNGHWMALFILYLFGQVICILCYYLNCFTMSFELSEGWDINNKFGSGSPF